MSAPARQVLDLNVPHELLRRQPPAQFALCDDGRLLVTVGEVTQTLTPEDIRRLDRFMNLFAAGSEK